jgi:hypothetical protein
MVQPPRKEDQHRRANDNGPPDEPEHVGLPHGRRKHDKRRPDEQANSLFCVVRSRRAAKDTRNRSASAGFAKTTPVSVMRNRPNATTTAPARKVIGVPEECYAAALRRDELRVITKAVEEQEHGANYTSETPKARDCTASSPQWLIVGPSKHRRVS